MNADELLDSLLRTGSIHTSDPAHIEALRTLGFVDIPPIDPKLATLISILDGPHRFNDLAEYHHLVVATIRAAPRLNHLRYLLGLWCYGFISDADLVAAYKEANG